MLPRFRLPLAVLALVVVVGALQADQTASLKQGTPDIKMAGPLAFGPNGVMFIGDPQSAAIFAIDTGDKAPASAAGSLKVEGIDGKIAGMLGVTEKDILVN